MKRIVVSILLLSLVLFSLGASFAYPESGIVETPDVKVIVNGNLMSYIDVPISISQRTLLPLRELLDSLGVGDDDGHIVWDDKEKSVTVYKNGTKIYLKVGSTTAYVNNTPVALDAAPVSYGRNQGIYVPVRFVSQALGKKVVWDGWTKTILIRDGNEFNHIKEILERSDSVMSLVSKARIKSEMEMSLLKQGTSVNFIVDMITEIDKVSKKMSFNMDMPVAGKILNFKSYYADNTCYKKNALTGKWEKESFTSDDFERALDENMGVMALDVDEALCAAMVEGIGGGPDEIVLRGNAYLKEMFNRVRETTGINKLKLDEYYLEIIIDRSSNLVKNLYMDISGKYDDVNGEGSQLKSHITCTYSDYEGSFEVAPPADLILQSP